MEVAHRFVCPDAFAFGAGARRTIAGAAVLPGNSTSWLRPRSRHAGRQCRCRGGKRLVRLWGTRVRPSPTKSDQKKYEYAPKRQNRTSAQGRPGTGQPPAGEGRFRSTDFQSALDTPATNTSVTNPTMAQRSDAQSRSDTGAPAEVANNIGRHVPDVEPGNLSGYIRVHPGKSGHRKYE